MTGAASYVLHLLVGQLLMLGLWGVPSTEPDGGVWPLRPRPDVVERFDAPTSDWGAGHRGVDLLGTPGQQVRAASAGTVSFAGVLAGRGVLVVDHGATRTTYEPVSAAVAVGDRVEAGQPIGSLELFGSHCWPRTCLHWGLLEGDAYFDPLTLVGAGPVRLLPLFGGAPFGALPSTPPSHVPMRFARPVGAPAGTPAAAGPW